MTTGTASAKPNRNYANRDGSIPEWMPGPSVPATSATVLNKMGYKVLKTLGWTFSGSFPDLSKFIIVVAPHTSNWDFVVGVLAKWTLKMRVRFLGKDTLFIPPLGWFMRAIGGIPVVRSRSNNLVEQTVKAFNDSSHLVLVLAPEGTRKRVENWKSGFWHIAYRAEVPICCVALDYGRKNIRIGPTVYATNDDAIVGVENIRSMYADVVGKNPSQQ